MVGSPLIGFASDRLKCRKIPYIAFVALFTLCWAVLVFWNRARPPVAVLYPLSLLLGIFGSGVALTFALGKEVNPPHIAGMAVAIVNIGAFIGISVLQPLMGYILDLHWDGAFSEGVKIYPQEAYYYALRFCFCLLLPAVAAALLVKETKGENCYGGK